MSKQSKKKEMGTNPSNAHETKASATYDLKKKMEEKTSLNNIIELKKIPIPICHWEMNDLP